jgi:drug/metabolite transporter (DMT)-like permease
MLIIVNAMWGASFPINKGLNLQVDQFFGVTEASASGWFRTATAAWLVTLRFGMATVLLALFCGSMIRRVKRAHVIAGFWIGFFFFGGLVLQVIGLGLIPASRSAFITSLVVVCTPVMATLIKRRLPKPIVLVGVAVAFAGVAVLTEMITIDGGMLKIADDAAGRFGWGDVVTIACVLFFSGQILVLDSFGSSVVDNDGNTTASDSVAVTPVMFATVVILGCLTFGVLQFFVPEVPVTGSWTTLATRPSFITLVAALGLFPSLLAFLWMNRYQPFLTASQAAVIYTLEPFFASTWAMFAPGIIATLFGIVYANESFSWPLVVGGFLILIANAIALWPSRDG